MSVLSRCWSDPWWCKSFFSLQNSLAANHRRENFQTLIIVSRCGGWVLGWRDGWWWASPCASKWGTGGRQRSGITSPDPRKHGVAPGCSMLFSSALPDMVAKIPVDPLVLLWQSPLPFSSFSFSSCLGLSCSQPQTWTEYRAITPACPVPGKVRIWLLGTLSKI